MVADAALLSKSSLSLESTPRRLASQAPPQNFKIKLSSKND